MQSCNIVFDVIILNIFGIIFQDEMLTLMSHKVSTLLAAGKIRLLIIDSVAGLFRGADDVVKSSAADYFIRRSKKLGALGSLLHRVSARYGAVVIAVNQVCNM